MSIAVAPPARARILCRDLQALLVASTALSAFVALPAVAADAPAGQPVVAQPVAAQPPVAVQPVSSQLMGQPIGQPGAGQPVPWQGAAPSNFHWQAGDLTVSLSGQVSLGTSIRTTGINSRYVPAANGAANGFVGHAAGGPNGDDGDLNWSAGSATSSVVKTFIDFDAHTKNVGVFIRGKAWYDYSLINEPVGWGSVIGGYDTGKPLSQAGLNPLARFEGVSLQEAYGYGKIDLGPINIEARAGQIVVPWGLPTLIPGGLLFNVNAVDAAAFNRPGSVPQEWLLPTPGAYLKANITDKLSVDGFMLFESPQNVLAPCGTFTAFADWAAQGCDTVVFGPYNDATAIAKGYVMNRGVAPANHDPRYGVGASYLIDSLATRFGLYYAHVDSPQLFGSVIKSSRAGTPFLPLNPDGLNPRYFTSNAPGVESFAANFQTKIRTTQIYGEFVYHPNMPLQLATSDLLNAALSSVAPTVLRATYNAVTPGGIFWGYQQLKVGSFDMGVRQPLPPVLGAAAFLVNGEIALKQIYDLPNNNSARFARSDTFGLGPISGTCVAGATALQCSTKGYASPNAFTYRLAASLRYDDVVVPGLTVAPTIGITHDLAGWSYDGGINQGRVTLNLKVRAELANRYFAEIVYSPAIVVASYDSGSDRQFVAAVAGMKF